LSTSDLPTSKGKAIPSPDAFGLAPRDLFRSAHDGRPKQQRRRPAHFAGGELSATKSIGHRSILLVTSPHSTSRLVSYLSIYLSIYLSPTRQSSPARRCRRMKVRLLRRRIWTRWRGWGCGASARVSFPSPVVCQDMGHAREAEATRRQNALVWYVWMVKKLAERPCVRSQLLRGCGHASIWIVNLRDLVDSLVLEVPDLH
jgi:hypothetical protein